MTQELTERQQDRKDVKLKMRESIHEIKKYMPDKDSMCIKHIALLHYEKYLRSDPKSVDRAVEAYRKTLLESNKE